MDESRFSLRQADGSVRVYRLRGGRFRDCCVVEIFLFGGGLIMGLPGISLHTKTDILRIAGNHKAFIATTYTDEWTYGVYAE